MKNKLFCIIIIDLIILQAYKKDDEIIDVTITTICSKSKFQSSISDLIIPTSIYEDDENNIVVLDNKGGEINIIKLDTIGEVIWNKTYLNIPDIASNIIILDNNSIIVSSYKNNEIEPIANLPYLSCV